MAGNRKLGELLVKHQPKILRHGEVAWRLLREHKPVLRIKKLVILTRHEDVRRVLEADGTFSVTYGEHMEEVTGPFILGMDDGPRYQREAAALHAAAPHSDLPFVAELTRERAARYLRERDGSLDAVELADEVTGEGVDRYFGLPGCSSAERLEDGRAVFRAVFLDGDVPEVMETGKAAADRLTTDMRRAMDEIRSHGGREDTVLGRLLAAQGTDAPQLDDEGIPRSLLGLQAAWAASVPRAFSLALDVLLDRPAELSRLADMVRADATERELGTFLLDALRLQPQAPFLTRLARDTFTIAPGAKREATVKQGDIVFAVTQSGQMDRTVVDAPGALKPEGRPPTDFLHFGAGIHRCFGAAISVTQFGVLAQELLRDGMIERTGPLKWGPAFPATLPIRRV